MQLLELVWSRHQCSQYGARHAGVFASVRIVSINERLSIYLGRPSCYTSTLVAPSLRQRELAVKLLIIWDLKQHWSVAMAVPQQDGLDVVIVSRIIVAVACGILGNLKLTSLT